MITTKKFPFRAAFSFRPLLAATGLAVVSALHAGTPLICFPYAIKGAKTIPHSEGDWKGVNPKYDRANLTRDTLAALTPETPVIVRMETLRRAAIYATAGMRGWDKGTYTTDDHAAASALLEQLRARVRGAKEPAKALALFDVGFFAETLRQAHLDPSLDGYALLLEALKLRGADPEMEFALALASAYPKGKEHFEHLARAREGAKPGSLLAANLASHFSGS
ncbi:MAG: hypothetical protein Q7S40_13510 [Opitutaceae bacterium]|nr:hypothetical protein [Opitutaceae bacterium]